PYIREHLVLLDCRQYNLNIQVCNKMLNFNVRRRGRPSTNTRNGSSQTFRPHKYIMPFKHYKS
ncbi:hypothetical protein CDAR_225322, partial [Caerostris darwini]